MNTELLERIETLAGPQRSKTFRKAAEFILENNCDTLVETGCYRGNPADGQSTLILALLAMELYSVGGMLTCFDINEDSIKLARELLHANGMMNGAPLVMFKHGDSLDELYTMSEIRFAYLDSYDHEPHNPGPCQRHQLAELGAIYGQLMTPCAILLDDHVPETGGKTLLSAAFLKERGWTLAAEGYQLLFIKP